MIVTRLVNLNLTEAEKNDKRNFKDGQIIQFNQNLPNIKGVVDGRLNRKQTPLSSKTTKEKSDPFPQIKTIPLTCCGKKKSS